MPMRLWKSALTDVTTINGISYVDATIYFREKIVEKISSTTRQNWNNWQNMFDWNKRQKDASDNPFSEIATSTDY